MYILQYIGTGSIGNFGALTIQAPAKTTTRTSWTRVNRYFEALNGTSSGNQNRTGTYSSLRVPMFSTGTNGGENKPISFAPSLPPPRLRRKRLRCPRPPPAAAKAAAARAEEEEQLRIRGNCRRRAILGGLSARGRARSSESSSS